MTPDLDPGNLDYDIPQPSTRQPTIGEQAVAACRKRMAAYTPEQRAALDARCRQLIDPTPPPPRWRSSSFMVYDAVDVIDAALDAASRYTPASRATFLDIVITQLQEELQNLSSQS